MFLGGSRPGAPFGLRSSRRISFCSSQCLSHFALRNAYHTSLRPSSLFESRPPSLRVVFSLSQCLSHFTALFIVVRCALHRYYRVQLLFTWNPFDASAFKVLTSTFATIRVQLLFIWNPSPLRPHFTALFILDRYRPIACCMEVRTAIHTGCAILRTVSAHRNASADARPADEFGALDTNTLIRVLPASITENCHGERPNCTAFLVLLVLHTCEFAKWTLHRSNTHDRTCNPRTMWTYCLLHGR